LKRRDLIRHLEASGCVLDREGARHSVYRSPRSGRVSTVPRHREIDENSRKICRDLEVPIPGRS
jgi:predicted RNA binding protein YcfA (HicA-like mRNA interferase family)